MPPEKSSHKASVEERLLAIARDGAIMKGGGGAAAGLEMMHRRAQRGDPEAALYILNHVVPDIPPDEEDRK